MKQIRPIHIHPGLIDFSLKQLKTWTAYLTRGGLCKGASRLSCPGACAGVWLAAFFLFPATLSIATIHQVKQDGTPGIYAHIQDAMDAAVVGDTVLVWPGTYYENLNFNGKDLVLGSLYLTSGDRQYISQTIIDGNKNGNVITLENGESLASQICGFTIQNGKKDFSTADWDKNGSGILTYYSSITVRDNIIQNNVARGGGGIICLNGGANLAGNIIRFNHSYHWGGGVFSTSEDYRIVFDTINLNSVYLNTANTGSDIVLKSDGEPQYLKLDTLTLQHPGIYFVLCTDGYANPMDDIILNVQHAKITPIAADLYVSPQGSNSNSGLSAAAPLKNIAYAMQLIQPDSVVQRTIHLLPGTYSPETTGERFPIGGQSNIRLSGDSMENIIIDCQNEAYLYSGCFLEEAVLENLTTTNGFGALLCPTYLNPAGLDMYRLKKVILRNLSIQNYKYFNSQCFYCYFPDTVLVSNYSCLNGIGMQANYAIRTMDDFPMHVRMENIKVSGNRYMGGSELFGGGKNVILAGGGQENDSIVTGILINAEICDNVSWDTWFSNNSGPGFGTSRKAKLDVINATIGGNRDSTFLPGTNSTVESSRLNIYNSIFYNNNSPDIYVYGINGDDPATINFYYTLFENGPDGIMDGAGNTIVNWGPGRLDQDPLWDVYGSNPYALTAASPCVDAGTPMYQEGMEPPYIKTENGRYVLYKHDMDTIHLPATDLAGNPRIAYGRIDMGAYEFADTTIGIYQKPKHHSFEPRVYPNPFHSETKISFALLIGGSCEVQVFDMRGHLVKNLIDVQTQPGTFDFTWNGKNNEGYNLPSGYYIISVQVNGKKAGSVKVRKL